MGKFKMKKNAFFFLILLLVVSGSVFWKVTSNISADQKIEKNSSESKRFMSESSSIPNVIEIKSEGKSLKLSLNDIPQYKKYLMNEEDVQSAIANTQFSSIVLSSSDTYAILKYGCGSKVCSTIMLKTNGTQSDSIEMPTGIFQDYIISPDQEKVLIRYAYDEGGIVKRQIIVAIDLGTLEVIPFTSADLAGQFMLQPTLPVVSYDWIDNEQFKIETAALESSEYHVLEEWFNSEDRKTKDVDIQLEKTKRQVDYSNGL